MKQPTFTWNPQYHKVIDPRVSLNKPSAVNSHAGTYYDHLGDLKYAKFMTPRCDHDPISGDSIGVLIEESATNLCPFSKDVFSNWTANGSLISATQNVDLSPDGTTNATLLVDSSTASSVRSWMPSSNITLLASTVYSVSCYVRPSGRNYVWLTLSDSTGNSNGFGAKFDLSTKSVISSSGFGSGSVTHSELQPLKNGWCRLSVSGINPTTTARPKLVFIDNVGDSATSTSIGVVGAGVYIFGMQITQSTRTTSYIPTTSSQAITRPADIVSMYKPEALNQLKGTLVVVFEKRTLQPSSETSFVCSINNGSSGSSYSLKLENGTTLKLLRNTGSSLQTTYSEKQRFAVSFTYDSTAIKSFFNIGSVTQTATTGTSTTNQITIGCNETKSGNFLNGHICFISYYPYVLTDNELKLI